MIDWMLTMSTTTLDVLADDEVKEQALPIELKVPNAKTRAAMLEARAMRTAKFDSAKALFDNLEKTEK